MPGLVARMAMPQEPPAERRVLLQDRAGRALRVAGPLLEESSPHLAATEEGRLHLKREAL